MKKIILLFLGCMASLMLHAQSRYDFAIPNDNGLPLYYKISDPVNHYLTLVPSRYGDPDQYTKTYDNQMQALGLATLRIPATVQYSGTTYYVKEIGDGALSDFYLYGLVIILPEGLTTIAENGLDVAYSLKAVNFPSTLTHIGEYALSSAGSIGRFLSPPYHTTYDFSKTQLTEMKNVFRYNFDLEKIVFPETLKTITGIIGSDTDADNFVSITIPAAVETIGYFAGKNLNTIYMNPVTPPVTAEASLNINSTATVYVPIDATRAYETAPKWSAYAGQYREQLYIGPTGYTTYYLENENFLVPAGCTAYIITGVTPSGSITTPDQAIVKAFTAGKIIPKQTGFILQGTPNSTVIYQANVTGTEEDVTGNLLVGTATEQEISGAGYKYYILSASGDQGLGFYKQGTRAGTSIKLKPHRAGLRLPAAIARAKRFIVDFDAAREEAETTGIRDARPSGQPKDNAVYDLQGRRVTRPTRGIYIVNGKKVIINE